MLDQISMRDSRTRTCAPRGRSSAARVAAAGSLALCTILGTLILHPSPAVAAAFKLHRAVAAPETKVKPAARPVNLRLFRPLLSRARRLYDAGAFDLTRPIEVSIEGEVDELGVLRAEEVRCSPGDANLRGLADEFVRQLNGSGVLQQLEGVRRLALTFKLDSERLSVQSLAEAESAPRAARMADTYNSLLAFGRLLKGGSRAGAVLNNMKVSASGKQLALRLEMSRAAAGNLLFRRIPPH